MAPFWSQLFHQIPAKAWLGAVAVSALLLLAVLSRTSQAHIEQALATLVWPWFIVGVGCIVSEGLGTAARLRTFTPGAQSFATHLRITAWFVLLLVVLPARLGEFAPLVLLRRYADQRTGPALASLLIQRLFDLLTLVTIFAVLALTISGLDLSTTTLVATGLVAALVGVTILGFGRLLRVAVAMTAAVRRRWRRPSTRQLYRAAVQACRWQRQHLDAGARRAGVVFTLVKWSLNLVGLAGLLWAFGMPLTFTQALLVAAAYNFLAIIPLQTIGGIGITEVGLTGLLLLFGVAIESAAATSILVRFVLIASPLIFWMLVMATTPEFGADKPAVTL